MNSDSQKQNELIYDKDNELITIKTKINTVN